jgi:t-SNARE complex subunit (syntaxin)
MDYKMNFNKEIKNTHDEIMKLHEDLENLSSIVNENTQNISSKLDSITKIISNQFDEKENKEIFNEPKLNSINVNIQQPRLITNILCILVILNICITSTFLFNTNYKC